MLFVDMKCFSCGKDNSSAGKDMAVGIVSAEGKTGNFTAFSYNEKSRSQAFTIYVCDSCLNAAGRQDRVVRTVTANRPPNYYEYYWNPDGDKPYCYPPPVFCKIDDDL